MQDEEVKLVVSKLLDTKTKKTLGQKTKKTLGQTIIFVQERWVEEHLHEDWIWYELFMRNLLRKVTPPKTKFISFKQSETDQLELCLIIQLNGCEKQCKVTVNSAGITWDMVEPT